jgi:hypothetical protein
MKTNFKVTILVIHVILLTFVTFILMIPFIVLHHTSNFILKLLSWPLKDGIRLLNEEVEKLDQQKG